MSDSSKEAGLSFELLKIIAQPVVAERDEEGRVIGEKFPDPVALYTEEEIVEYIKTLEAGLKEA